MSRKPPTCRRRTAPQGGAPQAYELDRLLSRHQWRLCLGPFELERSGRRYGFRRFNTSGGTLGGQLGYNWQTGRWCSASRPIWVDQYQAVAAPAASAPPMAAVRVELANWLGTTRASATRSIAGCLHHRRRLATSTRQPAAPVPAPGRMDWALVLALRGWAPNEYLRDLGTASFMGAASARRRSTADYRRSGAGDLIIAGRRAPLPEW